MFRAALGVVGLLSTLAVVPPASAEGNSDYSVLIISRERLEVATNCEIGVYLNDQLSGRMCACACYQGRCQAVHRVSKINAAHV